MMRRMIRPYNPNSDRIFKIVSVLSLLATSLLTPSLALAATAKTVKHEQYSATVEDGTAKSVSATTPVDAKNDSSSDDQELDNVPNKAKVETKAKQPVVV